MADEHWRIDTPENIIFDYEVAGIGSRFLAALVDTLLILLLQAIVGLGLLFLFSLLGPDPGDADSRALSWLAALFGLIAFAFLWGYYVFFEMLWNGQSPGKRWAGLRVIRTDGTPIALTESLIRNLVRFVDFLPAYYGVGVVTMFINEQARRLGDLAAGTLVVRDRATVTLESLAAGPVVIPLARLAPEPRVALPLEKLNSQELQMAEDFVRRSELSGRSAVARRIAQVLLARMDLQAHHVGLSPEELIQYVVQASRDGEES